MKAQTSITSRLLRGDLALMFYFSLFRLLFHFVLNAFDTYGYFRDELYYIACAKHLAAGYVDQPPLSIFILKLNTLLFGDSIFALRIPPALAGAVTVFLTGLITIRLGGKRFAQGLACLCSFSLITLAMNSYYSMNSIDIALWALTAYIVIRIIDEQNKQYWIVLGVVLGLGLLNKIGVLFLGAGLFAGLLLTDQRKWLTTIWPYAAGIIALLIFSPYIIWNATHDWAHLEFIHNASAEKYASLTAMRFIKEQFLLNNPIACLVWLAGLIAFFTVDTLKPYRLLIFLYAVPFIIFVINKTSKGEYLAPGYAVLWAAGGIAWERLTDGKRFGAALRTALCILIAAVLLLVLPMVVSILPVKSFIAYSKSIGMQPSSSEDKELSELPQFYADRFGWEEKAQAVAKAYNTLSEKDKAICTLYSNNYGRCGAIDFFGNKLGLPSSIGSHNNYWIWGPGNATGKLFIVLGDTKESLEENFETVEEVAVASNQYCMPYENNTKVFICRNLKGDIKTLWPLTKHYE